jgi:hypothetical protein
VPIRIDDLPAEQIEAMLAMDAGELPEDEELALRDFIQRIGGKENAVLAVEMLLNLE